jgi:hypothetical protein
MLHKLLTVLSLFSFLVVGVVPGVAATTTKHPSVLEYKDPRGMTVQLYDTPCVNKEILAMGFPKKLLDQSHAATITQEGRQLEGCWLAGDGVADIITQEGETGELPMFIFSVVDPV